MTEKLPPLGDSDKMLSWSHDTFAALSGEGAKEVKELIMDSMRNAVPESVWRGIDLSSGSCAIRGDDNVMRAFLGDILVLVCIWCRETVATYITVAHLQVRPKFQKVSMGKLCLLKLVIKSQCTTLQLYCFKANKSAQKFYQRMNFKYEIHDSKTLRFWTSIDDASGRSDVQLICDNLSQVEALMNERLVSVADGHPTYLDCLGRGDKRDIQREKESELARRVLARWYLSQMTQKVFGNPGVS